MKFILFIRKFLDAVHLRRVNADLVQQLAMASRVYEILKYNHEHLNERFKQLEGAYAVVRREALQAEQIITGVQNHLRSFPNDTSRAVKNMLAAR